MLDYFINQTKTIMEAMGQINDNGVRTLIVVDKEGAFLGTLSDGDIRRAILSKRGALDLPIKIFFNSDALALKENKYSQTYVEEIFKKHRFDLIPVIDIKNSIKEIIFWNSVLEVKKKKNVKKIDLPVVIMAGGRGSRISEFTDILPKPLIPLDKKPIIEHIIDKFLRYKIKKFHITTNYKSRLLKAYFQEIDPPYSVNFFEEKIPSGTVGGLAAFGKDIDTDFFLTNCDIVIDADYSEILDMHKKNKNLMTLVVSANNTELAYGVCDLDEEGNLIKINEKPNLNYLVNTGFYILSPEIFRYLKKGKHLDMDKLIEIAIENKEKVGVFPIHNSSWSDVGQWHEYIKTLGKNNGI